MSISVAEGGKCSTKLHQSLAILLVWEMGEEVQKEDGRREKTFSICIHFIHVIKIMHNIP